MKTKKMTFVANYLRPQKVLVSSDFIVVDVLSNSIENIDYKVLYTNRSGRLLKINFDNKLLPNHYIYSKDYTSEPIKVVDDYNREWELFVIEVDNSHFLVARNYELNKIAAIKVNDKKNVIDWLTHSINSKVYNYPDIVNDKLVIKQLHTNNLRVASRINLMPTNCILFHKPNNLVKHSEGYFLTLPNINRLESYTLVNPFAVQNKTYSDVYFIPKMDYMMQYFVGRFHIIGRANPNMPIREVIAKYFEWSLVSNGKDNLWVLKTEDNFLVRKVMVICGFMITKESIINNITTVDFDKLNYKLKKACVEEAVRLFRKDKSFLYAKEVLSKSDDSLVIDVYKHAKDFSKECIESFLKNYSLGDMIKVGDLKNHPELNEMLTNKFFAKRLIEILNT